MASNIKWKRVLSFTWLALTLSLLHLGLGSCLTRDCYIAETQILPFMLILSFPGGWVCIAVVASLDLLNPMDFPVLWVLAFAGGSAQWFWLFPKLTNKREIIALRLGQIEVQGAEATPKPLPGVNKRIGPPPQFDRNGRTPLERALKLSRN